MLSSDQGEHHYLRSSPSPLLLAVQDRRPILHVQQHHRGLRLRIQSSQASLLLPDNNSVQHFLRPHHHCRGFNMPAQCGRYQPITRCISRILYAEPRSRCDAMGCCPSSWCHSSRCAFASTACRALFAMHGWVNECFYYAEYCIERLSRRCLGPCGCSSKHQLSYSCMHILRASMEKIQGLYRPIFRCLAHCGLLLSQLCESHNEARFHFLGLDQWRRRTGSAN